MVWGSKGPVKLRKASLAFGSLLKRKGRKWSVTGKVGVIR